MYTLDHGHPSSEVGWLFSMKLKWPSYCSEDIVAIDRSHPMFSYARCRSGLFTENLGMVMELFIYHSCSYKWCSEVLKYGCW